MRSSLPSLLFAPFRNRARETRGSPQSSLPRGLGFPEQGNRPAGGSPLPGSFLPALLWPAQEKDGENKEKAKRGLPTLSLERTLIRLYRHGKYCTR